MNKTKDLKNRRIVRGKSRRVEIVLSVTKKINSKKHNGLVKQNE